MVGGSIPFTAENLKNLFRAYSIYKKLSRKTELKIKFSVQNGCFLNSFIKLENSVLQFSGKLTGLAGICAFISK